MTTKTKTPKKAATTAGKSKSKSKRQDPSKKAKTSGKAPNKAKPAGSRGRKPAIPNDATIKMLVESNPRRKGSTAYQRFALYKDGMAVGDFIKKGGRRSDVACDCEHKRISVSSGFTTTKTATTKTTKTASTQTAA